MSFAQVEYLPAVALVLALYALAPSRWRVGLLLLASWLFYLWVEPRDGVWLALATVAGYFVAQRVHAASSERAKSWWTALGVVLLMGLLATFKYSGFALTALGQLSAALGGPAFAHDGFALPLGISFYTFQTLSYVLDVRRKRIEPARDLAHFALYVSFFPQLVAGPIERARHLLPQLSALDALRAEHLAPAARLIVIGLAKKWLIADRLYAQVWPLFSSPDDCDSLTLLVATAGMWVMLYLDFSAYSDLARGSARLFGVELVRNFERPFLATSVRDWAGRWHTSLGAWMFDYVWAPLGSGAPSYARVWRSNLVVMTLFGLWHGANWTFVLWGLGYGVLISCEHSVRLWRSRSGARAPARTSTWRSAWGWLTTSLISLLFIALFFSPSLGFFAHLLARVASASWPTEASVWLRIGSLLGLYVALLGVHFVGAERGLTQVSERLPGWLAFVLLLLAGAACVLWRASEPQPFVYFQF